MQVVLKDCKLQHKLYKNPDDIHEEHFLNRNVRIQLALQTFITLAVVTDLLIIFGRPTTDTQFGFVCQLQGSFFSFFIF